MKDLTLRLIAGEAAERVAASPAGVAELRSTWTREELRAFAFKCLELGAPWVAVGAEGPDACVTIARPKPATGDLRTLLPGLLERARGKGGGSPDALQVAAADPAAARAAWEWVRGELPQLVRGSA